MPAPETNIPALFLPAHLRLGATNWKEFKQAIETVCRVAGVEDNLTCGWRAGQWSAEECDEWAERDELCKAIITLNIRDFSSYGVSVGKETTAQEVWAQLVKLHAPKRWFGLFEWVRPFTRLEWILLAVACCCAVLLILSAAEMNHVKTELANVHAAHRFEMALANRIGDGRRLRYTGL